MKEIKKIYAKPSMLVLEIESKQVLLTASQTNMKYYDTEEFDGEFS